jgi:hypothetical protein
VCSFKCSCESDGGNFGASACSPAGNTNKHIGPAWRFWATGTLPPEWGQPGSFPSLRALGLNFTRLRGTLPPQWGKASAMASLDVM